MCQMSQCVNFFLIEVNITPTMYVMSCRLITVLLYNIIITKALPLSYYMVFSTCECVTFKHSRFGSILELLYYQFLIFHEK